MSSAAIRIDGLAEFARNLGKLDRELPKALRIAMNQAADLVVADARPNVPKRTGRAAKTIRAASTRTAVRVTEGGKRAPYMPWLDYGGKVGRNKSVRRPFIKEGRYLYPAYFRLRDSGKIQEVLAGALIDVAAQAGVVVD
jgi:hypothetical protein